MKPKIKKFLFALFFVFISSATWSQMPQKMSYQSIIRDVTGKLISNQIISIKISILQGNNPVYVEIHKPTTNANGLVTLEIGGVTPILGSFASIDWSKGYYNVKLEIDPLGGTNYTSYVTANPILSVPYALYSKNAEDLKISIDDISKSIKSIDAQILNKSSLTLGKNLFNKATITLNNFVNWGTGNLQGNASSYCASDFINVNAGETYYCNTSVYFRAFYDVNYKFISGSRDNNYPVAVPEGGAYIRITCNPTEINGIQFEKGLAATDYKPYEWQINEQLKDNSITMSKLSPDVVKAISSAKSNSISPYSGSYDWDINMLPIFGQSLSVGSSGTNASSNLRNILSFVGGCNESASNVNINDSASVSSFYGKELILLSSVTNKNWSPVAASTIAWMSLLEKENGIDFANFDYQFVLSTPGQGGAAIYYFRKGTDTYNRLLFSVKKALKMALNKGKTFGVPVLFWVQGESNANDSELSYYNQLNQLFIDLNSDIKAITGQSKDVQFITYQGAPVIGVTAFDKTYNDYGPAFAQVKLAIDKENVHFGGAMYQFSYSDLWHPNDGAFGLQMGIQAKRIINDKQPLKLFYPQSYSVMNSDSTWLLSIQFDVPVPPMRFDVSGDIWHNPNGKQPNFGFTLVNNTNVSIIAEEPVVKRGNTLVIKCKENPVGANLSYALNGHYGGGNLCDSQNIIIQNKGVNYVVDNFCPAFRNYIIKP